MSSPVAGIKAPVGRLIQFGGNPAFVNAAIPRASRTFYFEHSILDVTADLVKQRAGTSIVKLLFTL
jgi:hypothetical protein